MRMWQSQERPSRPPVSRINPDNPYSSIPFDFFNLNLKEVFMNTDQTKGSFKQLKGKLKETWGRLTDDDLALYEGQQDQFFGKVQEKYGIAREEAERQIRNWNSAA